MLEFSGVSQAEQSGRPQSAPIAFLTRRTSSSSVLNALGAVDEGHTASRASAMASYRRDPSPGPTAWHHFVSGDVSFSTAAGPLPHNL